MFRGPLLEPLALIGWCLVGRLWQMIVLVSTAAHTLLFYFPLSPLNSLRGYGSPRETLVLKTKLCYRYPVV